MFQLVPVESPRETPFPRTATPARSGMSGLLVLGLLFVFFFKFIGGGGLGSDMVLGQLTSMIRMTSIALMVAAGVLMFMNMPSMPSLAPPAAEPVFTQAMVDQLLAQQAMYHKRHMLVDRAQQVAALNMATAASAPMVLPPAIVARDSTPESTPSVPESRPTAEPVVVDLTSDDAGREPVSSNPVGSNPVGSNAVTLNTSVDAAIE